MHAELQVEVVPLASLKLGTGQRYSPDDDALSNPEMKKIFKEEQRVRQDWPHTDWTSVSKPDASRRVETMRFLQEGALRSGEDFSWAAFVFSIAQAMLISLGA